jgi:hypothetical protein
MALPDGFLPVAISRPKVGIINGTVHATWAGAVLFSSQNFPNYHSHQSSISKKNIITSIVTYK